MRLDQSRQVLDGDVIQLLDAILVHKLDLEVGQVDDQPLVDFLDTVLHEFIGLILGHVWKRGKTHCRMSREGHTVHYGESPSHKPS